MNKQLLELLRQYMNNKMDYPVLLSKLDGLLANNIITEEEHSVISGII